MFDSLKDIQSIFELSLATAWVLAESQPVWFHNFWTTEHCPSQYREPAEFAKMKIDGRSYRQI